MSKVSIKCEDMKTFVDYMDFNPTDTNKLLSLFAELLEKNDIDKIDKRKARRKRRKIKRTKKCFQEMIMYLTKVENKKLFDDLSLNRYLE